MTLVALLQHLVDAVEIEAPGGDVRASLVAVVDGEEGVGVALGEVDDLGLVGLRVLADVLGLAARARQDVVGVGFRLVARALLVGARALHVVESVDHRQRRLDAQQLHLGDLDAGVLGVEQRLQQRLASRRRSAGACRTSPPGSACG